MAKPLKIWWAYRTDSLKTVSFAAHIIHPHCCFCTWPGIVFIAPAAISCDYVAGHVGQRPSSVPSSVPVSLHSDLSPFSQCLSPCPASRFWSLALFVPLAIDFCRWLFSFLLLKKWSIFLFLCKGNTCFRKFGTMFRTKIMEIICNTTTSYPPLHLMFGLESRSSWFLTSGGKILYLYPFHSACILTSLCNRDVSVLDSMSYNWLYPHSCHICCHSFLLSLCLKRRGVCFS